MPQKSEHKVSAGFTLVELLLVIGIIAVLAVVVFVALDPVKRFADSRDARRTFDVETILSAVQQYTVDNKGVFPVGITQGEKQLGISTGDCSISTRGCATTASDCVDLRVMLTKYLKEIPIDPTGTIDMTKYTISLDVNNIITVKACGAEGEKDISSSR